MGNLKDYISFISHGNTDSGRQCLSFIFYFSKLNTAYEEKLSAGSTPEKVMLELLWDVDTLKRLNKQGRALLTHMGALLDLLHQSEADQARHTICIKSYRVFEIACKR